MLGTGDIAAVNDRTGQGIGVLFVSESNEGICVVKATEEDA